MSNLRSRGIAYLRANVGQIASKYITVSKLYGDEESWTRYPVWWFDLSIEKIKANPKADYFLLCEEEGSFVVLRVPNKFLIDSSDDCETRYQGRIRLHLGAEEQDRLVDQRGKGHVDFSKFELKL